MQGWRNQRYLVFILSIILLGLEACQPIDTRIAEFESESIRVTNENLDSAIFAGGCFWCTESDFDKLPGVVSTQSGYIGGHIANPTYEQVVDGETGHIEAVKVVFDKTKTDFSRLLEAYWVTIDPLTPDQQFCDQGSQYRSAIFYRNPDQKALAEASKLRLQNSGRFAQPIVTEILPATEFYRAEEYHQDYSVKNPLRYAYYRKNCGRDQRLKELWGIRH